MPSTQRRTAAQFKVTGPPQDTVIGQWLKKERESCHQDRSPRSTFFNQKGGKFQIFFMFNLEDEGQDVEEEETKDDMDGGNGKIE